MQCYGVKEVEMVDSVDEIKILAINCRSEFPRILEMLDARIAFCSEQDHPGIPTTRKKVSPEEQKAQKEDRFLRRRQIAYMIYDYFRVTGAHDGTVS